MRKRALLLLLYLSWGVTFGQSRLSESIRNQDFEMSGPVMQYITVKPFEIRVEVMVQAAYLIPLLEYPLKDSGLITIDEQAALFTKTAEFFKSQFLLTADGVTDKPARERIHFLRIGDEQSVIRLKAQDEPVDSAVLGLSWSFEHRKVPEYFQMEWSALPAGVEIIPCILSAGDRQERLEFSEYVMALDWGRDDLVFDLPLVEPLLAETNWWGAPRIAENKAPGVLKRLLGNVYNAFKYVHEKDVYEKLSLSVSDAQLPAIYLEQRRLLDAVSRGGPEVEILDIEVNSIEDLERSGKRYTFSGQWSVSGSVTHFGHTHDRLNQYQAHIELAAVGKYWKLDKIEILGESRLQ